MVHTLQARSVFAAVLIASASPGVAGDAGFLRAHRNYDADFQSAMASVMGCGTPEGVDAQNHTDAIKRVLTPMWDTLPKNQWGKVEWRMLRYAAHRYFMQQYQIMVVGLEPMQHANESSLGSADVMSGKGASILDAVLKGKVSGQGFSLDDITLLLATLERAIYDTDAIRLEEAYGERQIDPHERLNASQLEPVISMYMAIWTHQIDGRPLHPEWFTSDATWIIKKLEFDASRSPRAGLGRVAMHRSFAFEDVHRALSDLTRSAASFWEADCRRMKSILGRADKARTGRVSLSDFYGKKSDGVSNFAESEEYLRALGALDETSTMRGKQVLISNYLQAPCNCHVATAHYMVCCKSECEDMLNEIQDAVGAPAASVEAILRLVQGMTDFDDEPPALGGPLVGQLQRIARMHSGQVPLHGRLFALWLHYVFPRECPHPRKVGSTSAKPIGQFTDSFASDEEVQAYSAQRNMTEEINTHAERARWMSQWSDEDEVEGDALGVDLGGAPWERAGGWLSYVCGATAMLGAAWALTAHAAATMKASGQPLTDSGCKSNFV